jgi:hypothetical protein
VKTIPHREDGDLSQSIRANSKVLADAYQPFMDLRVKIHGQPNERDLADVIKFKDDNQAKMSADETKMINELIDDLTIFYAPTDLSQIESVFSASTF